MPTSSTQMRLPLRAITRSTNDYISSSTPPPKHYEQYINRDTGSTHRVRLPKSISSIHADSEKLGIMAHLPGSLGCQTQTKKGNIIKGRKIVKASGPLIIMEELILQWRSVFKSCGTGRRRGIDIRLVIGVSRDWGNCLLYRPVRLHRQHSCWNRAD